MSDEIPTSQQPRYRLWHGLLALGASEELATDLMNDFAHELAEEIRKEANEPSPGPLPLGGKLQWNSYARGELAAAEVIDPQSDEKESECSYTFAHTRHWCGHAGCREG